jgi:hypothetical protein
MSPETSDLQDTENTTVRYSLSAIKRKIARGASKTRSGAPEAALVGEEFWKRALVVMPPANGQVGGVMSSRKARE